MSKTLGQRSRVPLVGFADLLVVGALLLALVAVPPVVRWQAHDRYPGQQDAIEAQLQRLPLVEPSWRVAASVPFGTVDLPGPARELVVRASSAALELWVPPAPARLVGGGGHGLGVVELVLPDGATPAQVIGAIAVAVTQIAIGLGVDAGPFQLLRHRDDPSLRADTAAAASGLPDQYVLAEEATRDGTTIRVRTVEDQDRIVLVVGVEPADRREALVDRVASTVELG